LGSIGVVLAIKWCNCVFLIANISKSYWLGGKMKKDLDSIILTRQELQIMKAVWDRGEATVKEVCDAVSQRKATAYTTVLTLMGILEGKGVLVHSRSGRAYIYKPLLTREQATRNQINDVLARFFDGNPEKLVANILENEMAIPVQFDGA
jgi:BlaI family transcriptional regulator, penicillinase repressor